MPLWARVRRSEAADLRLPAKKLVNKAASGKLPSLKRNITSQTLGNAIYLGSQGLILVVLARLGSARMVGQFSLGMAVAAPAILLSQLNLRQVLATDPRLKFQLSEYVTLRAFLTVIAVAVICVIAVTGDYSSEAASVIVVLGLAKGVESMSDIAYGYFEHQERMSHIARSLAIKGPGTVLAVAVVIFLTGSVLWASVGLAVVWIVGFVAYDLRTVMRIRRSSDDKVFSSSRSGLWLASDFGRLQSLAWTSLPMGIASMLVSLQANIPRYAIEGILGEKALGIYAALAYILSAQGVLMVALARSALPRLATLFEELETASFQKLLFRLCGLGALVGVVGFGISIVAGRAVLSLLFGAEYAPHVAIFQGLMGLGIIINVSTILGYGVVAARRFAARALLMAISSVLAGVLSFVLIPRLGLAGAVWALGIAIIARLLGEWLVVRGSSRPLDMKPESIRPSSTEG